MLERLAPFADRFTSPGELRRHVNSSSRIAMRKGVLLSNGQSRDGGISARVYRNGVYGFAAAPQDDDDAIRAAIAAAEDNADSVGRADAGGAPLAASALGEGVYDYRSARPSTTPAGRVEILRSLDAAIRGKFPHLVNVDITLSSHASEKTLVTSEGARAYSYVPRSVLGVKMAIEANDGLVELYNSLGGFGEIQDQSFEPLSLSAWLDDLYEELRRKAEGGQCEAGLQDVVLDSDLAGILAHEAIGHTCEADYVLAGSVAGDWVGEAVASEKITLVDYAGRGFDDKSSFAIHVDDEGTVCRDVTLIEKGVLRNFLHSKKTAAELGAEPAGNARAFSFSDEPLVRMRNTAIAAGADKLEDMIGAVESGYYLKRATNGQADFTSEFMFGVSCGYEIRKGKLGRAIRDTTISGVAFDMLKTVTHVGDEFRWSGAGGWCGKKQPIAVGMGGPAIKCKITVGGRG
ncbi:TldD/PmbA family protein [Methylocystis heyeri]|uniref:TldD/PmbA family protein n=1 Tax=Methylocystis heyeri TaxID=391905 RepID=A0A6B8KEG9_9HYPH|nr:TldD/PmbA family protein [Methylocystis heyeri]QGM44760.1 TldD/PmbA family protein [Methylocystis heyeri]